MSSFIAHAPAPTGTTPEQGNCVINDGFFPDIDLARMREAVRLDGTVIDTRLRDAAIAAILLVNRELRSWKAGKVSAGYTTLAAVPAQSIDGASELHHLYLRAVNASAKADLTERYRDYDLTGTGDKKADELTDSIDEQRRNAAWAIADIQGRTHITVELI